MTQTETVKSPPITEREAAKYLRISPRTLWTVRRDGRVRATVIGRKVFYTHENLDRFIGKCESSGPADGK